MPLKLETKFGQVSKCFHIVYPFAFNFRIKCKVRLHIRNDVFSSQKLTNFKCRSLSRSIIIQRNSSSIFGPPKFCCFQISFDFVESSTGNIIWLFYGTWRLRIFKLQEPDGVNDSQDIDASPSPGVQLILNIFSPPKLPHNRSPGLEH